MPFWPEDPFLTIEGSRLRNIDPQVPENLFGMWSVFSKCAGTLEDGKRLEYMSWRLWNHQTVIRTSSRNLNCSPTNPLAISPRPCASATRMPELSSSVDSLSDDASDSSLRGSLRGSTLREDGCSFGGHPTAHSRRLTREKSFTPVDLENLVTSIKSKQELKDPIPTPSILRQPPQPIQPILAKISSSPSSPTPRGSSPRPVESSTSTVATAITDSQASPSGTSDSSVESDGSHHSVVRGFQPGGAISTYRSSSSLAPIPAPILKSSSRDISRTSKRKTGIFSIGAGSSGEDDSSFRDSMSPKKSVSIDSAAQSSPKKHASFHEKIFTIGSPLRRSSTDEAVIESDEEGDDDSGTEEEISESAIDDEDDAWEDEADNDRERPLTFARIDSKPNLTSRRSLLTDKVHEGQRASALQTAAARTSANLRRSRTSTPNGPSMPASPEAESPLTARGTQDQQTKPIIMTTSNTHPPCPPAFSPRTTRRNMLAVELDIDLRKNMLVERQQKSYYSHGGLQRRHTSNDVKNLKEYADVESATGPRGGPKELPSWNEYFDSGFGEYHQKGW